MGRITKLLNFIRAQRNGAQVSDSEVDTGGGANISAPHFAAAGDDSHPLRGDYVATAGAVGQGRENAVGYLDPRNQNKAEPGEKRIYARSPEGDQVVEFWLKNNGEATTDNRAGQIILQPDGAIVLQNRNGSITLQADGAAILQNINGAISLAAGGEVNINGARITTAGDIISASGVSMVKHTHTQQSDAAGDIQRATRPPTATE